jgi:hypothetical protein
VLKPPRPTKTNPTNNHFFESIVFLPLELEAYQRRTIPEIVIIKENARNTPSYAIFICSDSMVLGMIL